MNVDEMTQQIRNEQAEKLLAQAQKWPVGSRWTTTDGQNTATVVGFDLDLVEPWFLDDDLHGQGEYWTLSDFVASPDDLAPATDDTTISDRARSLSRGRGIPQHVTLWDTPASAGQILAAIAFKEAGDALVAADRAARAAADLRSTRIATVVSHCDGNQSAAARLLGMDQSRISRAISSLPVIP